MHNGRKCCLIMRHPQLSAANESIEMKQTGESSPRAARPWAPSPPPRSRSGSEAEEAELSLSLARTKTGSYGSTASVRAPLGAGVIERHVEHRVCAGDTLQGIALKYGVTLLPFCAGKWRDRVRAPVGARRYRTVAAPPPPGKFENGGGGKKVGLGWAGGRSRGGGGCEGAAGLWGGWGREKNSAPRASLRPLTSTHFGGPHLGFLRGVGKLVDAGEDDARTSVSF
ncbi:PREDICTED: uncharacterized protein LOC102845128 [Elephantulus edwardii]|uniref:uncharacterized protein LOC102845128 n=1 Tax=Elephantulus edwardii TaxID=28737 RepID=UPI0003F0E4C3|nr:PREDICTED: uncharacterized protein LOC102845128 [Elephantulus edwardii]